MTLYTQCGNLPHHQYSFVDSSFVRTDATGFEPCVWFGLVSMTGRSWGCTVMLECGAIYRNVPLHAMACTAEPENTWEPRDAQVWDCYGPQFTTYISDYLGPLDAGVRGKTTRGSYLFSAAPVGDAFTQYPEQAKEFTFLALDNGRYACLPTDRVLWTERSFTGPDPQWPTNIKRQTETYSSE
jgi:hypothetical protein